MVDQALAKINSDAAARRANQEFANYQWLENMKRGMLGQRGAAESAWVDTGLKPLQAKLTTDQAIANLLAQINATEKANMFYGVNTNYQPYTPGMGAVQNATGINPYLQQQNQALMNYLSNLASRNYQLPQYGQSQTTVPARTVSYQTPMEFNPADYSNWSAYSLAGQVPSNASYGIAGRQAYPWEIDPSILQNIPDSWGNIKLSTTGM